MKPLRTRLLEARQRLGVPWEVLERDYVLSWLLAGIAEVPVIAETLVFKGGTALKKCYFGDYRFSEDLDFSGMAGVPGGADMEHAIAEVCDKAVALLDPFAPIELTWERYLEKAPHPSRQEAFIIRARLPWQRLPGTTVMIETSVDEKVLKPPVKRKILHEYGEPFAFEVFVYALEEIVAEKLRAILQHIQKLEVRGWSRSRARDYYDLWRIFGAYKQELDLGHFEVFLREKCAVRDVSFKTVDDFFPDPMMAYVKKTWQQWLGPLVPRLPPFDVVTGELQTHVKDLIG